MASHRLTAGLLALAAAAGCRLDRIPPGTVADGEAIRGVITAFHDNLAARDYRGFRALFDPDATVVWDDGGSRSVALFWDDLQAWHARAAPAQVDARPVRLQVRHSGDAGTAWMTSLWTVTRTEDDTKTVEHRAVFLLHRRGEHWRVVSLLLQRQSQQSS